MSQSRTLVLTVDAPASATTTEGTVIGVLENYDAIHGVAILQASAGGAVDVYIQHSLDGGTTWYDCAHFPQIAAGSSATYDFSVVLDSTIRAIGSGTSPALAANTVVAGPWFPRLRLLVVTRAGSNQIKTQTVKLFSYQQNK